jgi:hypothetical protein
LKVEDVLTKQVLLEEAVQAILKITKDLISQRKSKGVTPYLDIVRDVINLVPVHWLSEHIVRWLVSCLRMTSAHPAHPDRATSEDYGK